MKVQLLKIDYDISQLNGKQWMKSDYQDVYGRSFDQSIRKSFETRVEIPQTNKDLNGGPSFWRVLKYVNGHFNRHIDRQIHPYHIGTQILLPPLSQCTYDGGDLIVQNMKIRPHEKMWTKIYIILGTIHQINQVKGTRISFVRPVFSKQAFKYNSHLNRCLGD